jgi:hypothetical protein
MKLMLIFALFFCSGPAEAATQTFCIKFNLQNPQSQAFLSNNQCQVDQATDPTLPTSTWTCSFNGGQKQSSQTLATWITGETPTSPNAIFYPINPGAEFGDFILKGMGLPNAKAGASLELELALPAPLLNYTKLMIVNSDWSALDLNLTTASYGNCSF